ncbi:site-specific DNA-methyltransferase [Plantactinospora sp. S1510]|uniref:Methyltransferase n=1 Tax=Plantactinospora alkalitolerans TaxID=2789879 RepID=A0ABS0H2R6_9ACTN|nr:DNA methyltransferase [Plantactinospora alkalitolerans]MBF9132753.1 site-specific DNA-methyltransferase [Plantactinospora alkalitolerans]
MPEHTSTGHSEPDEPDTNGPAASEGYQRRHREYEGRHRADPEGLSVWATAQSTGPVQRRGRYVPESVKHPARMLPAIAAHAIHAYTQPGDLVVDPMCGIGTTLVEAVHAGRDAFGIEYEPQWSNIADANIHHAHSQGATGRASVIRGDATRLVSLVPAALTGQAALVVTSPPYGPTVHGLVRPGEGGVVKHDDRYGEDKGNLAYRDLTGLADGFAQILHGCATLLRPGGVVVVTARPWRKRGELVDLPSAVIAAGLRAGLVPIERCVALLAAVRDGHLVARPSFFQLQQVRKARSSGVPMHLIAHEDVLIFAKETSPKDGTGVVA